MAACHPEDKNKVDDKDKGDGSDGKCPAGGWGGGNLYHTESDGFYWSSSLGTDLPNYAYYVSFSDDVLRYLNYRFYGFSVRPVSE